MQQAWFPSMQKIKSLRRKPSVLVALLVISLMCWPHSRTSVILTLYLPFGHFQRYIELSPVYVPTAEVTSKEDMGVFTRHNSFFTIFRIYNSVRIHPAREATRICMKLKLLTDTYILRSKRSTFGTITTKSLCPLCDEEEETKEHFLLTTHKTIYYKYNRPSLSAVL